MKKYKNFKSSEFDSPDLPGSGKNMKDEFMELLQEARNIAGVPFRITSGFRTKKYNKLLMEEGYKTSKDSSHIKGLAVDISTPDSISRYKILSALLQIGYNRIGIANNFIHCDIDSNKQQNLIWTYY